MPGSARGRAAGQTAQSVKRAWGRRGTAPRVQGIRFRLGLAMALALLPILLLGVFQAQSSSGTPGADRRAGLQFAAERTAAAARARIDSTAVLLEAIAPRGRRACSARLAWPAWSTQLEASRTSIRFDAIGRSIAPPPTPPADPAAPATPIGSRAWFQRRGRRLRRRSRAPAGAYRTPEPAVLAAVRAVERPRGVFAGALASVIRLSSLRPDTIRP